MITTTVEDAGPCRKKLSIEVSAERVDAVWEEALQAYRRTARVPGFRPGRAPRELVARRFARPIADDLRERLLAEAYREAIAEKKLSSVAILELKPGDVRAGNPFAFEVTLDIAPEFELPVYRGIRLRAEPVAPVDDDAVDKAIESIRRMQARYEPVEGRPAREHDLARIDFEATHEGRPLDEAIPAAKPLARGRGFQISLDEQAFLPDLGRALVGAAVGDRREADVTFPDAFSIADLRGKTARFAATVTELRERILPAVDDTLAAQVGAASLAELRGRIHEQEQQRRTEAEERRLRGELARHLVEAAAMELPETLVEQETRDIVQSVVRQNARRGVPEDELVAHKQEIYEHAQRNAREQLKLGYVLHRIAEAEGMTVSDEEVERHGRAALAGAGVPEEQARERLQDARFRERLREDLLRAQAMDWVRREAAVETPDGAPPPPPPTTEESR